MNKLIAESILSDKKRASFTCAIRITYKWSVVQLSAEDACYIPSVEPTNRYYLNSRSLYGSISLTTAKYNGLAIFLILCLSIFKDHNLSLSLSARARARVCVCV